MSKNGLLVCSPSSSSKNIGDYIQSIAQEQFWDRVDCYCEREALDKISSEQKINLIMNGWFIWNPQNFPPADCINPLFISFHLNPLYEKEFFSPKTIKYLKRYEPIGARDRGTVEMMEKHGIKSYFSSCLTLTLGQKYKTTECSGEILFVDPMYEFSGAKDNFTDIRLYFKTIYYAFLYGRRIRSLLKNFEPDKRSIYSVISEKLNKFIQACHFYASYKDAFDEDLLREAKVITHNVHRADYPTNKVLMCYARDLVKRYARASLVVTSRIHCALPCLAVETPVIYVNHESLEGMNRRSPGRMNGILELFNVFTYDKKVRLPQGYKRVTKDIHIQNSDHYKKYAVSLIKTVQEYITKIKNSDIQYVTPPLKKSTKQALRTTNRISRFREINRVA